MSFVIPFRNYRPSKRNDAIKWTNAHAQEATDNNGEPGAWNTIESFAIADYPDPTNPPTLNFTTDLATQRPGWYRIRFTDTGSGEEFTAGRFWGGEGYRPSTRDVALYIKNRTADPNGNYLGDFTADTAVTADEVEGLISKAQERVLRKLDVDPNEVIATESHFAISNMIALYAAMLVELTKYSEQIQANRSPYPHLKDLFDEEFAVVVEDVTGIPPVTTGTGSKSLWDIVATQDNTPSFSFPEPDLVNWDTRF